MLNFNYLLPDSEVFTEKSQTKTLQYWLSDSEVNIARQRFEIFLLRLNDGG